LFPVTIQEGTWLDVWTFKHRDGRTFLTEKGAVRFLKVPQVSVRRYGKEGAQCKYLGGKGIFTLKVTPPVVRADEKVTVYLYLDRDGKPADLQIFADAFHAKEPEASNKERLTTAEAERLENVSKDWLEYWSKQESKLRPGEKALVPRFENVVTKKTAPSKQRTWCRAHIKLIKEGKEGNCPFSGRRRFERPGVVKSFAEAKRKIRKEILNKGPVLREVFHQLTRTVIPGLHLRSKKKRLGIVTVQRGLNFYVCYKHQIPQVPKDLGPALQKAINFLKQALADGQPREIAELVELAKSQEIPESKLHEAKILLAIRSDGKTWRLPILSTASRCEGDFSIGGNLHVGGKVIAGGRGNAEDATKGVSPSEVSDREWLTCPDLASRFQVDQEALRGRLKTFMKMNQTDWNEITERHSREPRYFYRVSAVLPIIKKLKTSAGRISGECPAK
jgi:hypothetical protein